MLFPLLFLLLPKTLAKIQADVVKEVIIIAPTFCQGGLGTSSWCRWYARFHVSCHSAWISCQSLHAKGTLYHFDLKTLRLAAWKRSCRPSRLLAFHKRLSAQPSHAPDLHCGRSTMADGEPLLAGVMNRILIPFMQL